MYGNWRAIETCPIPVANRRAWRVRPPPRPLPTRARYATHGSKAQAASVHPAYAAAVVVERISGFEALDASADELAARHRSLFQTHAWLDTWWRHLGAGSSNFRQQVRRKERRLEREHGLRSG